MSDLIHRAKLMNYISEHSHYDSSRPAESYAMILQAVNGFPTEDKDEFLCEVIEHYGKENQMGVAQEECAELIQAISKTRRGEHNTDHIIEEIADVTIMLWQLKLIYTITDFELDREIEFKLDRLKERMHERCT